MPSAATTPPQTEFCSVSISFSPKGAQLFASFFGGLVSLRFIPGPNPKLCVRTASGLEQMESS